MNQFIDLSLYCFIAIALLGSMFYMLITCNKNDKIMYFLSLLSNKQTQIYNNITQERMNIYLQGFVLGLIIAVIYLRIANNKKYPVYCIFVAIVLGVTYIHYTIMPKSTYMLEHIDTPEQAQAWLEIYKQMKLRCHTGMVLGVASLPFICYVFN